MRAGASIALILSIIAAVLFGAVAANAAPATVVIDARNGDVLVADNADVRQAAPALPKLMTIYLMFEAFEAGTVRPATNIFVSASASKQPQPSLGLREFDTISAGMALDALLAASANDAAAVLAEFLAGSEARFVEKMNEKAKALGLTNTHFANISGAPDQNQYSTPRDMIRFSLALMRQFPERAKGLIGTNFAWRGKTYQGPRNFLGALSGNQPQGVSRAKSDKAQGRDVIAVVWNAANDADADRVLLASLDAAKSGAIASDAQSIPTTTAGTPLATGNWGIQLGAFSTEAAARQQLAAAAQAAPELSSAQSLVEPLTRPGGTLYRARYTGIEQNAAQKFCTSLKAASTPCMAFGP